jgi:hypothetical protein
MNEIGQTIDITLIMRASIDRYADDTPLEITINQILLEDEPLKGFWEKLRPSERELFWETIQARIHDFVRAAQSDRLRHEEDQWADDIDLDL